MVPKHKRKEVYKVIFKTMRKFKYDYMLDYSIQLFLCILGVLIYFGYKKEYPYVLVMNAKVKCHSVYNLEIYFQMITKMETNKNE